MKVAILFLAAALGSASPVRMQNSMQARDAQNACDCSKPFQVFDVGETQSCPDGYKNIAVTWFPKCVQIGCSAEDHKAQCDAKPQDAKSPTAVEQPTPTDTKPQDTKSPAVVEQPTTTPTTIGEQNACDCSKPFLSFDLGEEQSCLDGYKNIAPNGRFPRCAQIGCSIKDYKAQCDAKPQDATPAI